MLVSNLLTTLNNEVFSRIEIPKEMLDNKGSKKVYDAKLEGEYSTKIKNSVYYKEIGNIGVTERIYDKSKNLYIKHIINKFRGVPAGFEMSRVIHKNNSEVVCKISEFITYYNFDFGTLTYGVDLTFQYLPSKDNYLKIKENEKAGQIVNLFDEFHKFVVDDKYRYLNENYKEKYTYNTSHYVWKSDNKIIPNGELLDFSYKYNHKKYTLHMENNPRILESVEVLVMSPIDKVIHRTQFKNWVYRNLTSKNGPKDKVMYRTIPVTLSTNGIKEFYSRPDLEYLKEDEYYWIFYDEFPTMELIKEKVKEFENNVIEPLPEAIRYNTIENSLDNYIRTSGDHEGLIENLIILQKTWPKFWESAIDKFGDNTFTLIEKIWYFIISAFGKFENIGQVIVRKYFTFDGSSSTDVKYPAKSGTYVRVSKLTQDERFVQYYPKTTFITYKDIYKKWKNADTRTNISSSLSKYREETVPTEDFEIVHFFYTRNIKYVEVYPTILKKEYSKIKFHVPANYGMLYVGGDEKKYFQRNVEVNYELYFVNRINSPFINVFIHNGSNDEKLTTSNTSIEILIFRSIDLIYHLVNESTYSAYKHIDLIDCYHVHLKNNIGKFTRKSNQDTNYQNIVDMIDENVKSSKIEGIATGQLVYYKDGENVKMPVDTLIIKKANSEITTSKTVDGLYTILSTTANEYIKFFISSELYDIRSGKPFKKSYNIFEARWTHEKYGELVGTYSEWNREPDSYQIIDFSKIGQSGLWKCILEKTDLVLGSSNFSKQDYSLKIHTQISVLYSDLISIMSKENTKIVDGYYYSRLFLKFRELFDKVYEFNVNQSWSKVSRTTDSQILDIIWIKPVIKNEKIFWWSYHKRIKEPPKQREKEFSNQIYIY